MIASGRVKKIAEPGGFLKVKFLPRVDFPTYRDGWPSQDNRILLKLDKLDLLNHGRTF